MSDKWIWSYCPTCGCARNIMPIPFTPEEQEINDVVHEFKVEIEKSLEHEIERMKRLVRNSEKTALAFADETRALRDIIYNAGLYDKVHDYYDKRRAKADGNS